MTALFGRPNSDCRASPVRKHAPCRGRRRGAALRGPSARRLSDQSTALKRRLQDGGAVARCLGHRESARERALVGAGRGQRDLAGTRTRGSVHVGTRSNEHGAHSSRRLCQLARDARPRHHSFSLGSVVRPEWTSRYCAIARCRHSRANDSISSRSVSDTAQYCTASSRRTSARR